MSSDPDIPILFWYELAAAAGGSKCPPVSPEIAKLIKEHVPQETLAVVERQYRAIQQAVAAARPDDDLNSVFVRVREILDRPH